MLLPKYSKLEVERRFLVDTSKLPPFDRTQGRLIDDLYLEESRLRLRSIRSNGSDLEYKLCKKYGSAALGLEPVVNIYLSVQEHAMLAALPGFKLRKRRFRLTEPCATFGIDFFENALEGLVLAEVEAVTLAEATAIAPPGWMIREVTNDPFYTGGNLCRTSATKLAEYLRRRGRRSRENEGTEIDPCHGNHRRPPVAALRSATRTTSCPGHPN